jgi:hypothetical protein
VTDPIPVGTVVRVRAIPDLSSMPAETQAAFRASLGKELRVVGYGPYGHLELEPGAELDAALGGFMNTIWIEPEYVEVVE